MARPSVTVLAVLTAVAVVGLSVAADASSAAGAAACYNGPPAVVVNEGADVYLGNLPILHRRLIPKKNRVLMN